MNSMFWRRPNYSKATEGEFVLDGRRIYILPNKAGLLFLLVLLCMFITSINYGINLGYALIFILISCGWLGIIFTYKNLAKLGLEASPSPAIFAGELAHFSLHLNNHSKHARYAIAIGFTKSSMQLVDIPEYSSHHLTLATQTQHRGWIPCPKIRLHTSFPFGLLIAWSYWQTTQKILVYPAPELNPPPLPLAEEGSSGNDFMAGHEEFNGVRNYQIGDPLKLLAWRQMARQSGGDNELLISKNFEGGQRQICVLDFSSLPAHLTVEEKLSRLCAWLRLAEQENVSYAFKLGVFQLAHRSGEDHQRACLTALALYE